LSPEIGSERKANKWKQRIPYSLQKYIVYTAHKSRPLNSVETVLNWFYQNAYGVKIKVLYIYIFFYNSEYILYKNHSKESKSYIWEMFSKSF